jgi:hypothetical protein
MSSGYGQIFLLLLAIGLILLGASGKTKQIIDVLKGKSGSTNSAGNTNGSQPYTLPDISKSGNASDQAGSGSGGVLG